MHRSNRKREPRRRRLGLPLLFVGVALVGIVVGGLFGSYIIRTLIEATSPSPPAGGAAPGDGVIPDGGDDPGGGADPGGADPGGADPGGADPSGPTPTSVRIQIEPRQLFTVQIGAFSERGPAETIANEAAARGLACYVWEPVPGGETLHRARCGLATSRDGADRLAATVKAAGYDDAFVASFETAGLDITLDSLASSYLMGFAGAMTSLDELVAAGGAGWNAFFEANLNPSVLADQLPTIDAAAKAVRNALTGLVAPADLAERHDVLQGLINMGDAATVELAAMHNEGMDKYPRAMTEFMAFVATFSRVCASWR